MTERSTRNKFKNIMDETNSENLLKEQFAVINQRPYVLVTVYFSLQILNISFDASALLFVCRNIYCTYLLVMGTEANCPPRWQLYPKAKSRKSKKVFIHNCHLQRTGYSVNLECLRELLRGGAKKSQAWNFSPCFLYR